MATRASTLVEISPDRARSATEFSRRMMESTATLLLSANARRSSEKPRLPKPEKYTIHWIELLKRPR